MRKLAFLHHKGLPGTQGSPGGGLVGSRLGEHVLAVPAGLGTPVA